EGGSVESDAGIVNRMTTLRPRWLALFLSGALGCSGGAANPSEPAPGPVPGIPPSPGPIAVAPGQAADPERAANAGQVASAGQAGAPGAVPTEQQAAPPATGAAQAAPSFLELPNLSAYSAGARIVS